MLGSHGWQRLGLVLNLTGAGLLFFSFQATSSNIRIVTTSEHRTAICVEGRGLLVFSSDGNMEMGSESCPDWTNARPAAVVNIECPALVTFGFIILLLGFVVQYFSIPKSETIEELRKQRKLHRKVNR